ncbi:GGDEF domain-containing protein [Planctomyces sp. SH-PL62]|uniref:GGDEF domain-containing protein n=1 Tax=Planctomyces sp. SH-PL62 TaxID=1636152 RepID=UPI00078DF247|nr:diguanylate cyclase [Planctomyces sp. SH-PL62]AMV35913.1 Phytochrome-like protein cph2 [Planctomyces sp. SH-PL62]
MSRRLAASPRRDGPERAGATNYFQRVVDALLTHIAVLRPDGEIVAVNAAWSEFAARNGLAPSRCGPGMNYLRVCEGASDAGCEEARLVARGLRDVARGRVPDFQLEYPCHSPTQPRWFLVRATRFVIDSQVSLVVMHDDVTERKLAELELRKANHALEAQVVTDGLTGASNRRLFDQVLSLEWSRHVRTGAPLSMLLLDVDHFKRYNDLHGHLAGDDCLREVARTLLGSIRRPGDVAARYGGEEFAAILPRTDRAGALAVAAIAMERLRLRGLRHAAPGAGPLVTMSVGCATIVPTRNVLPSELVSRADRALYAAKQAGRDRIVAFDG